MKTIRNASSEFQNHAHKPLLNKPFGFVKPERFKALLFLLALGSLTSCVQEEHLKKVTFRVDMRNVPQVGTVQINGDFISPPWSSPVTMTDTDGDGIYEFYAEQETAKSTANFKFIHNRVYELEGQDNRKLVMTYAPEEIIYTAIYDNPQKEQESTPLQTTH